MKTYHLKEPDTVWAIQFDGTNINEIEKATNHSCRIAERYTWNEFITRGGSCCIEEGDYVVKKDMTGWYVSPKDFFEQRHIEVPNE